MAHGPYDYQFHICGLEWIPDHVERPSPSGLQVLIPLAGVCGDHQARLLGRRARTRQQFAIGSVREMLVAEDQGKFFLRHNFLGLFNRGR